MDSMRSLLSTSDFLQVREHKLSNDLTVWLNEDHSQPKIFGAVVVKAGAKDSYYRSSELSRCLGLFLEQYRSHWQKAS